MSSTGNIKDPAQLRQELSKIFDAIMAPDSTAGNIIRAQQTYPAKTNLNRGD